MATLTTTGLTMMEIEKRHHGKVMHEIIDNLSKTSKFEIIQDIPWREADEAFSNTTVRCAYEPSGSVAILNAGTTPDKGQTTQVRDVVSIFESRALNDVRVINALPNPKQGRNDEVQMHIRGVTKTMISKLFYGNNLTDPSEFTGIANRMDALAASNNVLNAGGTGSTCTSVYVVDWSPVTCHCVHARNSVPGVKHDNLGQVTVASSGSRYEAYEDKITVSVGIAVKNERSIGRLANIADPYSDFDPDDLVKLKNRMTRGPGMRIYVNTEMMSAMEIAEREKTNTNFTKVDGLAPGFTYLFDGIPIRCVDQITSAESAIS